MKSKHEEKTDQELIDPQKDRAARCFRKKHAISILVIIVIFLLLAPTGEYLSNIGTAYRNNGISWKTITELGWSTRWFIGRFRGAPSDERMIAYLNDHRAEFDRLAKRYYEDVAKTGSCSKTNQQLVPLLRSLGLWKVVAAGSTLIINFEKDVPTFNKFGVYFKLVDHGPHSWWGFGQKLEKTYLYMPTIPLHPKWSNDPIRHISPGKYNIELSTDSPMKIIEPERCAVRQIDQNWFIQNCDVEAYNF